MFPSSKNEALLRQLETEAAIRDLTLTAYEYWLPFLEANVFPPLTAASPPPDPNGANRSAKWWRLFLDNLIIPGIGYIWAYETIRGYLSLGGRNSRLAEPALMPAPAERETLDPDDDPDELDEPEDDEPERQDAESDDSPLEPGEAPEPDRPRDTGVPRRSQPDPQATPQESPSTSQPESQEPGRAPLSDPSARPSEPEQDNGARERTVAELNQTARRTVARYLPVEPEVLVSLQERIAQVPTVRELQSEYLATVRNRMANVPDEVFRDIVRDLDAGLANGDSPEEMAKSVEKYLDLTTGNWRSRAVTVARTESAGAMSAATVQAAQLRNAELREELQQIWLCTIDTHTRTTHFAADGQRVTLGSRFSVGTAELRFPGDPDGPPGEVINCRCRVAVLALDEPLPLERGAGRQAEVDRRRADGVIRARDDEDGIGQVASVANAYKEGDPAMRDYRTFTAVLAPLGTPTDDGRLLAADMELRFRDFPLPLMWQRQSTEGHFSSFTVGVMESASVLEGQLIGKGYLLNTPEADEAAEQIAHKVTGPSVDLGDVDWVMTDTRGNPVSEESFWDDPDMEVVQKVTSAKLLGATLVAKPAFGETSITLGELVQLAVVAAVSSDGLPSFGEKCYNPDFFTDPQFTEPTLPHITSSGRIQGHLAVFNQCHVGIQDSCVKAPRSATNYSHFLTSPPVLTESGERVKVGRLTVGGGHADEHLRLGPAVAHYDDVGTCFALVTVGEDAHGIWFSGVPAPGATTDQLHQGLAAPLSGDWRMVGGNFELIAALAVNTPGFPIRASGATDQLDRPLSLVASLGPCPEVGKDVLTANQVQEIGQAVFAAMQMAKRRDETETLLRAVRKSEALQLLNEVK